MNIKTTIIVDHHGLISGRCIYKRTGSDTRSTGAGSCSGNLAIGVLSGWLCIKKAHHG